MRIEASVATIGLVWNLLRRGPVRTADMARITRRAEAIAAVDFSHDPSGPHAFTILRARGGIELRTPAGIALASGCTFAEVWRKRPRAQNGVTRLTETAR